MEDYYDSLTNNTLNYNNSTFYNITTLDESKLNGPTSIPFVPFGLGLIIVTTFGILGNIFCALVFLRKKLRSSYSILTLGLTFVDTVYLITKLLRYGLDSLFTHHGIVIYYTDVFIRIFGPYLRPLTFIAHTASTYFTMAIALDRYIVLSRPSIARKLCTTRQAIVSSLIVLLFSILYNIPRWWEYHTEHILVFDSDLGQNTIKYSMKESTLKENLDYKLYYIFWSYFIVIFIVPFLTLSILNFLVWRCIRNIQRNKMSSTQKRDTSFATMLIGVVIVFLLCNLDYLVLDLMDYFGAHYTEFWKHLGNILLTINSGVNFIIYCVCGRKFRKEACSCFKRNSASHDINNSGGWTDEVSNHIDLHYIQKE